MAKWVWTNRGALVVYLAIRATYTAVMSLNDLDEEGRSVLHRLGEDLQKVAIVIKVHQDVQLLQLQDKKIMKHMNS